MDTVQTLIDKAEKQAGSRYAVSKATGVPESTLSKIKSGKLGMSPAVAGYLAALIGADPKAATLLAVVSQEKDPERREALARMYGLEMQADPNVSAQSEDGLSYVNRVLRKVVTRSAQHWRGFWPNSRRSFA